MLFSWSGNPLADLPIDWHPLYATNPIPLSVGIFFTSSTSINLASYGQAIAPLYFTSNSAISAQAVGQSIVDLTFESVSTFNIATKTGTGIKVGIQSQAVSNLVMAIKADTKPRATMITPQPRSGGGYGNRKSKTTELPRYLDDRPYTVGKRKSAIVNVPISFSARSLTSVKVESHIAVKSSIGFSANSETNVKVSAECNVKQKAFKSKSSTFVSPVMGFDDELAILAILMTAQEYYFPAE